MPSPTEICFCRGLRLRPWLSIRNSSWWLGRPSGALEKAVTPLASTLETARHMPLRSGPANLCCSKEAISRQPMLPAQGSDTISSASSALSGFDLLVSLSVFSASPRLSGELAARTETTAVRPEAPSHLTSLPPRPYHEASP